MQQVGRYSSGESRTARVTHTGSTALHDMPTPDDMDSNESRIYRTTPWQGSPP